jgi:hypothetical protein
VSAYWKLKLANNRVRITTLIAKQVIVIEVEMYFDKPSGLVKILSDTTHQNV